MDLSADESPRKKPHPSRFLPLSVLSEAIPQLADTLFQETSKEPFKIRLQTSYSFMR